MYSLQLLRDLAITSIATYIVFRVIPRLVKGVLRQLAGKLSQQVKDKIGQIPLCVFFAILAIALLVVWQVVSAQRINEATKNLLDLAEYVETEGELPPVQDAVNQFTEYYRLRERSVAVFAAFAFALWAAWAIPQKWNLKHSASIAQRIARMPAAFDNWLSQWSNGPEQNGEE